MTTPALIHGRLRLLAFLLAVAHSSQAASIATAPFPAPEKLSYRVEWRMLTAGNTDLELTRPNQSSWQFTLRLESAGVVSRLFRVLDNYRVLTTEQFCDVNSLLDAQEGKRHRLTRISISNESHKLAYEEKDLVLNRAASHQLDVAPCTHDVIGGLALLRAMKLEPGRTITVPVTDGKKLANARIEAQAKEAVVIDGRTYQTIRYEVFLFDNVLYSRKGRLFIWLTEDPMRLPVQIRVRLGFPIYNISLYLQKQG